MSDYVNTRTDGRSWDPPSCCIEKGKYNRCEPGLFTVEFSGSDFIRLTCKSYMVSGNTLKQISKGVSIKQNPLTLDDYLNVLNTNKPHFITNRGFQLRNHRIYNYKQRKRRLNSFYCKRKVLNDGIEVLNDGRWIVGLDTINTIYVYCDIVQARIVSNCMSSLPGIVPVQGNSGENVSIRYNKLHYQPISKWNFSTISISLCDDQGNFKGKVMLTLHFRTQKLEHI